MHNKAKTGKLRTTVVAAMVFAVLAGCAQTKSMMSGLRKTPPASGDSGILGAPAADQYLQELKNLAAGDPATQAEIYADANSGAMLTPGPQTNLRYALVLATPGHSESNLQGAQSMLREILAQSELMTQSEVALATVYLKSVEQMIVLESEARRLRASSSRAEQTREQATNQRLASVEAENRRLRRELEDALEKLEAIQSIERSIREQE